MYLNGEGIQVIHQPAAHTDGDTIVFFRRGDVIATGDIIDTTRWPVIDTKRGGTVQGELDALNRLMDMTVYNLPLQWKADRTFLVPGHGHVYDKLDLLEYRDAVTIVRDRVQDLIDEGKTLAQVKAANPTLGYRSQYRSGQRSVDDGHVCRGDLQRAVREERKEVKKGTKPRVLLLIAPVLATGILLGAPVEAQRGNQPPPPPPRAGAPIDLTGYWVSIVTADWRWRMVTPAKGDYQGVQLNAEGRKVADTWDPAKDEAAGEQCKSYGAPALMSVPGRIHITWQDDTTLKVDTDAGTQTRLLRFGPSTGSGQAPTPPNEPRTVAGRLAGAVADAASGRAAAAAARRSRGGRAADSPDRRIAASRHEESACRVPAEERRSLQRERRADRTLGSLQTAERRAVAHHHDADRGSAVSVQRETDRAGVQEGSERQQMGSDALFVQMVKKMMSRLSIDCLDRVAVRGGSRVRPGRFHRHLAACGAARQRRRTGTCRSPRHASQP